MVVVTGGWQWELSSALGNLSPGDGAGNDADGDNDVDENGLRRINLWGNAGDFGSVVMMLFSKSAAFGLGSSTASFGDELLSSGRIICLSLSIAVGLDDVGGDDAADNDDDGDDDGDDDDDGETAFASCVASSALRGSAMKKKKRDD